MLTEAALDPVNAKLWPAMFVPSKKTAVTYRVVLELDKDILSVASTIKARGFPPRLENEILVEFDVGFFVAVAMVELPPDAVPAVRVPAAV